MSEMASEFEDNNQRLAVCNSQWEKKKRSEDKMKKKIEYRTIQITDLRTIRADGEKPKITGYAAVFDSLSEDLGGFREKIQKGAFKSAIKEGETRMLWNHNSDIVLGRQSAGTLTLKEDKHGLKIENIPPDTQAGRDAMTSIDRGDVSQMSFGFRIEKDEWEEKKNGDTIRTLLKIRSLPDVSPVTYPAYTNTEVALRSLEDWKEENKKTEDDKVDKADLDNKNIEDRKNIDDKDDKNDKDTKDVKDKLDLDIKDRKTDQDTKDKLPPDNATIDKSEQDKTKDATIESVSLKTIGLKLKTNQQIIDTE